MAPLPVSSRRSIAERADREVPSSPQLDTCPRRRDRPIEGDGLQFRDRRRATEDVVPGRRSQRSNAREALSSTQHRQAGEVSGTEVRNGLATLTVHDLAFVRDVMQSDEVTELVLENCAGLRVPVLSAENSRDRWTVDRDASGDVNKITVLAP